MTLLSLASITQTCHTLIHLLCQCKILLIFYEEREHSNTVVVCMSLHSEDDIRHTLILISYRHPSQNLQFCMFFFWRFQVGTSSFACFFWGSMPDPHVFLEVPCRKLQFCMFFFRFHARSSCFFGGSMSEPPVLHVFFFQRFHVKTSSFECHFGGSMIDSRRCSNSL